jgi:hypothetical protein
MTKHRRRQQESGFAMLMVFVMAAVVAISLYYEMPRVAFESQRFREQTLVDRGNQYRRAIQLFYRKFGRYPAAMDDLETTNNIRFLRHKYKDPMTGKDEWRLIHMGPGGILTDSLVQKAQNPLAPAGSGTATGTGSSTSTGFGSSTTATATDTSTGTDPNNQTAGFNLGTVRRPSDQMATGTPTGGQPVDPNNPYQTVPTAPLGPGVVPGGVPGQYPVQYPGQPVNPNQPYDPNNPNPNPNQVPVAPLQPYDPNNPNPPQPPPGFVQGRGGFVAAPPVSTVGSTPGQPGQPGTGPSAAGIIQNLLTTPRSAPDSSTSTFGTVTGANGTGGIGGIAGVASKFEGTGIKIIHDRKKYKEWEFVYDFKNDGNKQQGLPGQTPGQTGQPNGLNVPGTNTSTGATPGTGTTPPTTPTAQPANQ